MQNTGIKEKELLQQFFQDKRVKKLQQTISELRKNENEKFNIFKILKLDKYEIRHSNFLAWLLNPKGSHNLGDTFFKQFLQVALNENVEDINTSDIRIETEYPANVEDTTRRIDILIYSVQTPEFVCVIENKYGTEEHTGQCQAYKTFIEEYSKFRNYSRKIYIFLDLNVPTDEQLDKKLQGYKPITYRDIFYILSEMQQNLGQYNYTGETIKQYTEIIKENYTMIDKEIKKQYRIIYDTYKEVLDEAVHLKRQNEPPESEKSLNLAQKWWNMILAFTGGDMNIIPQLEAFNGNKGNWNNELAEKQQEIDDYVSSILNCYLSGMEKE